MEDGCEVGKRIIRPNKVHELVQGFSITSNTRGRIEIKHPDGKVTGPRGVDYPAQY